MKYHFAPQPNSMLIERRPMNNLRFQLFIQFWQKRKCQILISFHDMDRHTFITVVGGIQCERSSYNIVLTCKILSSDPEHWVILLRRLFIDNSISNLSNIHFPIRRYNRYLWIIKSTTTINIISTDVTFARKPLPTLILPVGDSVYFQ
jgi:hypothetical protein